MAKHQNNGPNLLDYISKKGYPAHELMGFLRGCALKNEFVEPSASLTSEARSEWEKKMIKLDHAAYPGAQLLNNIVLGETTKKRCIILTKGYFHGPNQEDLHTMIYRDLGNNPYKLFSRPEYSTIDAYITEESADMYVQDNKTQILRKGFNKFYVEASRFFYFREEDLISKGLMRKGKIDFEMLVPLVAELPGDDFYRGYVGLKHLWRPNGEKRKRYDNKAIEHSSHRFKQLSLVDKLVKKLCLSYGHKDFKPVCDIIGDRWCVSDEKRVRELMQYVLEADFVKEELIGYRDDYYGKPKKNLFRNLNMSLIFNQIKKHPLHCRELQIVDLQQYRKNELDPTDRAHHSQQKKKQQEISYTDKNLIKEIRNVLEEIFKFDPITIRV